eukprot:Skav232433  [mRNA]  locus=scaffold189:192919:197144:- [translate_table: standard]
MLQLLLMTNTLGDRTIVATVMIQKRNRMHFHKRKHDFSWASSPDCKTHRAGHLVYSEVQKHSGKAAYKRTGAKWDVHNLKSYLLTTAGVDVVNRLFSDIEEIVLHSLFSVQKVMINDKHCFEMYGYDILIDVDFKPWLLEVNASPSLTANTVADYEMKYGLLDDLLTLLDFEKYLTGNELQIGGFDLLYKDGSRYSPPEGSAAGKHVVRRIFGLQENANATAT